MAISRSLSVQPQLRSIPTDGDRGILVFWVTVVHNEFHLFAQLARGDDEAKRQLVAPITRPGSARRLWLVPREGCMYSDSRIRQLLRPVPAVYVSGRYQDRLPARCYSRLTTKVHERIAISLTSATG